MASTSSPKPAWRMDAAVGAVIVLVALLVRLPLLQQIPRLTDETSEVGSALQILAGGRLLTLADAYNGAHWAYLLAGVLRVFGLHPSVPRLFAVVLGALTVGATFLLASALGGRRVGLMAALPMATSMAHVVLMSHVAWNNHATPLWVTLAVWLTACSFGVGRGAGSKATPSGADIPEDRERDVDSDSRLKLLPFTGAAWGMALASHPSAVVPFAGSALWALAAPERRRGIASLHGLLGALALLLVVSPLAINSIQQPFAYFKDALGSSQTVTEDRRPSALIASALELTAQLGRTAAAGPLAEPGDPMYVAASDGTWVNTSRGDPALAWANNSEWLIMMADLLRNPVSWIVALVLVAALLRTAIQGPRLLATAGLAGLLSMPLFNHSYQNFYDTRYLGYILPLAYTALAMWLARGERPLGKLKVFAIAALVLYPVLATQAYYAREALAGRTNQPMLDAVSEIAGEAGHRDTLVLVDKAMRPIKLGGGGDPTRAFDQLLTLSKVRHELADDGKIRWFLRQPGDTAYIAVVADVTAEAMKSEFSLDTMADGEGWQVVSLSAGASMR